MQNTIVIVDDHLLIANALAEMIGRLNGFDVLYVCEGGKAFQEKLKSGAPVPDILLLDVNMPGMNGVEVAKWTQQHFPVIRVLALSMQDDEDKIIGMIRAGASGYLLKSINPAELENALNSLMKYGYYYTSMVTHALASGAMSHREQPDMILSAREREMIKYMCTDLSYKEIANELNLSVRTIETYANNLIEKMGVRGRIGLILFAQKNGLC